MRAWRDKRGLSQKAAAKLLGTSQGMWCSWELGTRRPELHVVVALTKLARIPAKDWLGELSPPKRHRAESSAAAE